ncbi:Fic family protein [Massilia sp. CCM 8734]|uniref:Fic family protein n=1 Tax=Massilia sp. CCM 8734 TaxID=2609283 RepID=UPI0034D17DA8
MREYVERARTRAPVISPAERKRREEAVNYGRASVGLENFNLSKTDEKHAQRFINGEIELAEFVKVRNDPARSAKPLTAGQRQALEATHAWQRVVELRLDPVRGNFDPAHLKEINRRIFQDLPGLGCDDVTPGEFRPPVAPGNDWIKSRSLASVGATSSVAYSSMNEAAQARLDIVLNGADPAVLSTLKPAAFTTAIGALYSGVDYLHPFSDGNSRTLREFTRQLAQACGYKLDWERFGKSPAGRDVLNIARDRSVNILALAHIEHAGTKRDVVLSMDQLEGNRDLPNLLRDAIRPSRAVAFEQLQEADALNEHADLHDAFKTLHTAAQNVEANMPADAAAQRQALLAVRAHIQARLDQGEVHDFRQSPTSPHGKPPHANQPG